MKEHRRTRNGYIQKLSLLSTIFGAILVLAGCEHDGSDENDNVASAAAPLMIPAYPSMTLQSIANTTWSSCEWNKDKSEYLFRIWRFSDSSAEIEGTWHSDTDTDCSATNTGSIGRTQYIPLQDYGVASAMGWRDQDGNETINADAPQSADTLGSLPGQPDARRTKFLFKSYYGSSAIPLGAVYQLLFLDASGAEPRLYIGSPAGSSDADGFPHYLNNFGVLAPYVE